MFTKVKCDVHECRYTPVKHERTSENRYLSNLSVFAQKLSSNDVRPGKHYSGRVQVTVVLFLLELHRRPYRSSGRASMRLGYRATVKADRSDSNVRGTLPFCGSASSGVGGVGHPLETGVQSQPPPIPLMIVSIGKG